MYIVRWDEAAKEDIKRLKARKFEIALILDAVDEQLTYEPQRSTKQKKIIRPDQQLSFGHMEPVWQLRVREFRVFYDVVEYEAEPVTGERQAQGVVSVRAVRRKPGHMTTKEIL